MPPAPTPVVGVVRFTPAPAPKMTKAKLMAALGAKKTETRRKKVVEELKGAIERGAGLMNREAMMMEDRDAPGRDDVMDVEVDEPRFSRLIDEVRGLPRELQAIIRKMAKQNKMSFRFGLEPTMERDYGLIGFMDVIVNKIQPASFEKLPKSNLMSLARRVLFSLFPGASQVDALVMSAFVNPMQTDGGIEVKQKGKKLVGSLIYEDRDDYDTAALRNATKKVLEDVKVVR